MPDKEEQRVWIVVRVILALILAAFLIYGYFIAGGTCGIDAEFLYCRLHPTTVWDIIGTVFEVATILILMGITKVLFGDQLIPAGSSWPNYAVFALGLIGALLIWFA